MAYGSFKTLEEVLLKFGIESKTEKFLNETSIEIAQAIFDFIMEKFSNRRNFLSENSICETMISPILHVVTEKHGLPLWSHVRFEVSEQEGLTGIPDFLIAPASKIETIFTTPVVCITEVKKENFDEGWTQGLCEMIAAQRFNGEPQKIIYGIATSGSIWQFAKLVGKKFILDPRIYSATVNLQQVLNVINWLLGEAKKELPEN
ncbi:MAG: hypothetical protein H7A23_19810 [Leptospiraceae bacterium]|nr:hypothetical protein [Leptospiraceae bacterium]